MKFLTEENVKNVWKTTDCVCFDVDSTVCTNEAIDDLAKYLNVGEQVEKLTLEAMGGNMTFREALRLRLNIIKPPRKIIDEFNKTQKHFLTPKIEDLINVLHRNNIPVYLVSGGFRLIINPVADTLNIPRTNVYANSLLFDNLGEYAGFDENEFTSETGGKGRAIDYLKKKFSYKNVVMIGDGATDLESCPPADAFIGFGGNIIREKVKKNCSWFVTDFQELIDELTK
jgi:phosphoserine phosphatase